MTTQRGRTRPKAKRVFDPNAAAPEGSGVFGLPHGPEDARVHLIPVPFEATTSYGGGTSKGPAAILEASRQVDLFDLDCGNFHEHGIWMQEPSPAIARLNTDARRAAQPVIRRGGDVGGSPRLLAALARVNRAGERVNAIVEEATERVFDAGRIPGIVGGDHSAPFGAIEAAARRYPGLGILHVDAHADLRDAYEGFVWSHASIMFNVMSRLSNVGRLVQVGIRDFCEQERDVIADSAGRIVTHFDGVWARQQLSGTPFTKLAAACAKQLPREVWISFDIDGLDPTLCPHTGTPVPGGLSFREAVVLMATVVASGRRVVGFDLCEVAPGPAGDTWDANVGARILFKMIGFALASATRTRRPRRTR